MIRGSLYCRTHSQNRPTGPLVVFGRPTIMPLALHFTFQPLQASTGPACKLYRLPTAVACICRFSRTAGQHRSMPRCGPEL